MSLGSGIIRIPGRTGASRSRPDAGKQRYPSVSDAGFSDAPIKGMRRVPVASSDGNFDQPPDYVNQGEPWRVSPDSDNGGCLNAAFAHVLV